MRVRLSQAAKAARNHALLRCVDDDAQVRLLRRFDAAEKLLARFPAIGRVGARPDTREFVLTGTPYVVVYRVEEPAVVILDIRHSSRKD